MNESAIKTRNSPSVGTNVCVHFQCVLAIAFTTILKSTTALNSTSDGLKVPDGNSLVDDIFLERFHIAVQEFHFAESRILIVWKGDITGSMSGVLSQEHLHNIEGIQEIFLCNH